MPTKMHEEMENSEDPAQTDPNLTWVFTVLAFLSEILKNSGNHGIIRTNHYQYPLFLGLIIF